jgi:polar amino acid transport system substrate-binding protein
MLKIVTLFLASIVFAVSAQTQQIHLVTEIFPPYQYKDTVDNRLIGISTEIVREIQKGLKDESKIKAYPWPRAVKLVSKKKNTAIFSMLRTKEREHKYKWVGPIAKMQLVFFKKKGSRITLKSIDDAKKVGKIGVTQKVANYDILKEKGFKNLDVIKSGVDEKNIKKLIVGRIDLWPALKTAGLYNARIMGFKGEIVPIENVTIFDGDLYIAFNKQTDDAIIKKWQKELDRLKKSGKVKEIMSRY